MNKSKCLITFLVISLLMLFEVKAEGIQGVRVNSLDVVKDVKLLVGNVYASRNPRIADNGQYCAVVLVQCVESGLEFSGNIVGDVKKDASTYYVYLKPGSKNLTINWAGIEQIKLNFDKVQPKHAYEVVLSNLLGYGSLKLKSDPSGADVILSDGTKSWKLGRTPLHGKQLIAEGEYILKVSKTGYKDVVKKVKIKKNKNTKIGTIKLKAR